MKIYNVNLQGSGHAECEDALYIKSNPCVAAITDGVTKAMHSQRGARAIAKETVAFFTNEANRLQFRNGNKKLLGEMLYQNVFLPALEEEARAIGCTLADLSCTLVCAFESGDNTLTLIHCGDGAVFGITANEAQLTVPLSMPDNDTGGRVYGVENEQTPQRMRIINIDMKAFSAVLLGSDGFTDPFINNNKGVIFHTDRLKPLTDIHSNGELLAFVQKNHLNIESPVTDDISCIVLQTEAEKDGKATAPSPSAPVAAANEAAPTVTTRKHKALLLFMAAIVLVSVFFTGLLSFRYKEAILDNRDRIAAVSEAVETLDRRTREPKTEKTTLPETEATTEAETEATTETETDTAQPETTERAF